MQGSTLSWNLWIVRVIDTRKDFRQPSDDGRINTFQSAKRHPMRRQDEWEEYPTTEKFYNDFKLMIRECFLSNPAGTPMNPAGIELQQPCGKAREALKSAKLPKKEEAPVASTSTAALKQLKAPSKKNITDDDILLFEQKELSKSVSKLEGSKLEKVMQIIREGVPEIRDMSPSEPFFLTR